MNPKELYQRIFDAATALRGTGLDVSGVLPASEENCATVRAVAALFGAEVSEQVCIYESGPSVIVAFDSAANGTAVHLQASRPATDADLDRPWTRYGTAPEVPPAERAEALRKTQRAWLIANGAEVGNG